MTSKPTADQPRRYSFGRRILLVIVPPIVALLIRALAATLRYEDICEPGAEPAVPGAIGVWCFWHQCLLTAACCFKDKYSASILISQSFDGELISRTIHRLGFLTARGSSSRGGIGGLRELARQQQGGSHTVFPADGPRGPKYHLKAGTIKLAQLTGAPVGPFHTLPQRAWKLRSWDTFLIPKPFSRVAIGWARPIFIPAELNEDTFEEARLQVEASLERARHLAENHFDGIVQMP